MKSLPTLPRRTWLERVSISLAGCLCAIGAVSLFGWLLDINALLQPFVGSAPIKINAALAFLILGGLLLAFELAENRFAKFGLVPATIGALTLSQGIFHTDLGIDQLLGRDTLQVGTEYPGRMSVIIALGLILGGLLVAWRAIPKAGRERRLTEAGLGSTLASVGFSTLLGHAASVPTIYNWGGSTVSVISKRDGLFFWITDGRLGT